MKNIMLTFVAIFSLVFTVYSQVYFDQFAYPLPASSEVMVEIADIYGDTDEEIIYIYGGANSLTIDIFQLNGDTLSLFYSCLIPYYWIKNFTILDANSDGLKDIVFCYDDSVRVMFQSLIGFDNSNAYSMYSGSNTDGIAKGDFNHDGLDDFACSNWNSSFITVFTQTQNPIIIMNSGFFISQTYPAIIAGYNQIQIHDVNGDGWDDVVFLAGQGGNSGVHVYLNYFGTFLPPNTTPYYCKIVDLQGNHLNAHSLSFGNFFGTGKGLLINNSNNGLGRFIQYENGVFKDTAIYLSTYQRSSAVADFNDDGIDELVMINNNPEYLRIVQFFGFGSSGISHYPTISGNYHAFDQLLATGDLTGDNKPDVVMISDYGGITILVNTSNVITYISENKSELGLSIYPNPATEFLRVSLAQSGEYNISVYDISGRIVLSKRYTEQEFTIDVSQFPKGIYSLRISGKEIFSKKFIVQ